MPYWVRLNLSKPGSLVKRRVGTRPKGEAKTVPIAGRNCVPLVASRW
jgi:hypothetical protein